MDKIKASILVITYNQEKTISRAIESLLRQECNYPWEILLADDASTDSTRSICEEYAGRYPELIRLLPKAPNKGLVGNYFDAFEAARGEYISDCAGDDEWLGTDRLRYQIEFLDANPDYSVCYCDVEVKEEGKLPRKYSSDSIKSQYFRDKVEGSTLLLATLNNTTALPYTLSAALYRKEDIIPYYMENREMIRNEEYGVEDVPIMAALGSRGAGGYLPLTGYRYHIEGESISNNLSYEKEFRFYSRILRLTRKLADFYHIPLKILKPHYLNKINHIAAQARHAGNRWMGKEVLEIASEWCLGLPLRARIHLFLLKLSTFGVAKKRS